MRCVCFLVELWWYKQGSGKHNQKPQKKICQIIGAQPIHNPRTTILTTRFWFRVWSSIVPQCFYLEFKGKRWSVCSLCWLKGHRNQPGIVLTEKNDGSECTISVLAPASGPTMIVPTEGQTWVGHPRYWYRSCQWQVTSPVLIKSDWM